MFNLVQKFLLLVSDFSGLHWLIVCVVLWTVLRLGYVKFIKLLLPKLGVASKYRLHCIDTIWDFSFTAISVLVISYCLEGNIWDRWVERLDKELTRCKTHEEIKVPGAMTIFILHTSFAIQDIINIWQIRGFKNLDFLQKQVFLSIFVLTNYSKCQMFGLSMMFLVHLCKLAELLTKLSFFCAHCTKSSNLHNISKALFGLSLLPWIFTFLYVYPTFLMHNKSVTSSMMKAEINMLIVLDFLTWVYLIVSIMISMFSRGLLSYLVKSVDRPQSMEYILFGCDPWILFLTRSQAPTILEDDEVNTRLNSQILRQTIHCSILIRRKVKRMREDKEMQRLASLAEPPSQQNSHSSLDTRRNSPKTSNVR